MSAHRSVLWRSMVCGLAGMAGIGTAAAKEGWVWRQMDSGTSEDLRAISMAAPDSGVAVGHASTVLRYDGETWQPVGGEIQDPADPQGASAFPGTPDRGGWGPDAKFEAVTVVDSNQFWIGSYGQEADQRGFAFWDGAAWTPRDPGSGDSRTLALWSDGPGLVLAGRGAPGKIDRFDGAVWKTAYVGTTGFFRSIHGRRDGVIWACGHVEEDIQGELVPRMLIYSMDEGVTWEPHPQIQEHPAASEPFNALFSLSESLLWAVGNRGKFIMWDGSALTAGIANSWDGSRQNLHGIWGLGADNVWAVGAAGTILCWDGQSWESVDVGFPVEYDLHAITSDPSGHLWIVGDGGVILHGQPAAP